MFLGGFFWKIYQILTNVDQAGRRSVHSVSSLTKCAVSNSAGIRLATRPHNKNTFNTINCDYHVNVESTTFSLNANMQRPVSLLATMKTQALPVFGRFTLDKEVDLKAALVNMGLGDMFNLATADFSRITSKCARAHDL